MRATWMGLAAVLCLVAVPSVRAQQEGKQRHWEPGSEDALLKQFTGDWDFTFKCNAQGEETRTGQGTESSHLAMGGFWLVCESKCTTTGGEEMSGKSIMGWNPRENKYEGVWIGSDSPFMGHFKGEADPTGKVFTFAFGKHHEMKHEARGEQKEAMPYPVRMVQEIEDTNHRTARFYGVDKSGKEQLWTEIKFTRKSGAK